MIKTPLVIAAMLFTMMAAAQQEQCTTPDESIADPNSITKCAIEDVDGAKKQVSIEVSTRRRVVRKNKEAVSVIGGISASTQVADVKKNTLLVGKLELEDNSETIDKLPFNIVEEIPLFPKCNNVPLIKQTKCFNTQLHKHITKNFRFPDAAINKGIGGRVLVQFTINTDGQVADILLRGPQNGELLENEAERIVKKLPKFIPGKHNGKAVKVKYGIPISFRLPAGVKRTNLGKANAPRKARVIAKKPVIKAAPKTVKEKIIKNFVKFSEVQSIPQFRACSKVPDMQKLKCFNERIISHIQRNFHYPDEAAKLNLEGKVWVRFIIDKNGDVRNIQTKGPQNGALLENEAQRMVSKLAKFVPGKHDGDNVNVEYYIPINFQLRDPETK